jgi:hypothetical protein
MIDHIGACCMHSASYRYEPRVHGAWFVKTRDSERVRSGDRALARVGVASLAGVLAYLRIDHARAHSAVLRFLHTRGLVLSIYFYMLWTHTCVFACGVVWCAFVAYLYPDKKRNGTECLYVRHYWLCKMKQIAPINRTRRNACGSVARSVYGHLGSARIGSFEFFHELNWHSSSVH